ncbi:hypothetical protein [Rhizobium sp. WW_1]|uniref:hypothetical protein n=1 Tax=Rhizobium sp. WW_1 TaxID=1907375 RepID=UPI0011C4904B|nr:hypothetical protein [Rhizobium sp. WW_1]
MGTIVHGVALNNPTVLHLGVLADIHVDCERPIYARMATARAGELNYFPFGFAEPVSIDFYSDCLNELDLLLLRPGSIPDQNP